VLKCDYRRHDSLQVVSAQTSTNLQKRRHAPSSSFTSVPTARRTVSENDARRPVSENELPENELPEELPEAEPRVSVSEPSLYVVNFVHIILSLSCRDEMFQNLLPLQSPATHHLRVFDIRDR
jgi:hypothetical protein